MFRRFQKRHVAELSAEILSFDKELINSLGTDYMRKTGSLLAYFRKFAKFKFSFHLSQVKRNLISSIKHFISELAHELSKDLRLGK